MARGSKNLGRPDVEQNRFSFINSAQYHQRKSPKNIKSKQQLVFKSKVFEKKDKNLSQMVKARFTISANYRKSAVNSLTHTQLLVKLNLLSQILDLAD